MILKVFGFCNKRDKGRQEGLKTSDITKARGPHVTDAERSFFEVYTVQVMKGAVE